MSGSTVGFQTQVIYQKLRANPDSIVFNRFDAAAIWELFEGYPINPDRVLRQDYRAFLQAAAMAALEGSRGLGKIKDTMTDAFLIPAKAGLPNITVKLLASAVIKVYHWIRERKEIEEGAVRRAAINAIAYGYSSIFDAIENDLDVDDYL